MDLIKITEAIRQQRALITSLDHAHNNLESAIESHRNIANSEYYKVFAGTPEQEEALKEAEATIIACSNTVNTAIMLLNITKIEISNKEAVS